MDETTHRVEAQWREADARSWEERALAIDHWLDHTEDLVEMFKQDHSTATQLRTMMGLVKTEKNDILNEAAKLRAQIADQDTRTN